MLGLLSFWRYPGSGLHLFQDSDVSTSTLLLDICCGTGAIGQCVLRYADAGDSRMPGSEDGRRERVACIGVEMSLQAVQDARCNAKQNGIEETRWDCEKVDALSLSGSGKECPDTVSPASSSVT